MKSIHSPMYLPDIERMMARSDVGWKGRIEQGFCGIPVANGRFGGPVWERDESTLSIQLNHTDLFMYNDACSHTDARSGAMGRINISFGDPIFSEDTDHHLSLFRGCLSVKGRDMFISVFPDMDRDILYVEIEDKRRNKKPISIEIEMLREQDNIRGKYHAISRFALDDGMMLYQTFEEKSEISVNDFRCDTAVYVLPYAENAIDIRQEEQKAVFKLPDQGARHTIVIGGCSVVSPREDVKRRAKENAQTAVPQISRADTENWWKDFWSASYVELPQKHEIERRRNYYFYLAAICNRGKFPGKYNGGNWIGEGDRRDWGAWYWNWNQDSLFQPLMDANHPELMDALFSMRETCYRQYQSAAEQLWGSKGIFIGETCGPLGYETLPEEIGQNLREFMCGRDELNDKTREFAQNRNAFLTPWNWRLSNEKRFSYVTHTMVATMETAEYYWKRYRQDLDERFLREKAYPFIRGAAEMYRNFYGFQKEADGYYHFHDTNLHEHIWGGWDVIDDHALARGVFAVAIKAAEILHTDDELIIQWQERLAHIAPYPTSLQEGALGYAAEHADGENVWAQGLEPAGFTRAMEGSESPQLKMIEKFDVLNMETRDQGMDGGEWAMAERTYHKMPGYVRLQTNSKLDHGQTSRFLQDIARMGHAEDYERILDYQVSLFPNEPNLIRRGGDYFSAQGYGTFSAAVQQGLCQCLAPRPGMQEVIRVFPSWPEKWDARFKLAAKRGFLVSSCMISGEVLYVEVESRLGGTLDIRTPYEKTDVYRNRNYLFSDFGGKNAFLSIETEKNDSIVFVKHEEQTDDSEE